ncbi:MAG: DUF115 domain-containing protein [Treponema sp.]|nr:DUF115 domain-containing protein [Treponema sp.]
MDKGPCFERNLLALSPLNPSLCSRLSAAATTLNRYKFQESATGEIIPALVGQAGSARPLHSMVDPRKEAVRLVSALNSDQPNKNEKNFIVFLGLGAGLAQEAALSSGGASRILVIDFDIDGIAELLCSRDYAAVLGDPRCTLLVDPTPGIIESTIFELYLPALCGDIKMLPLRARIELGKADFGAASGAVQRTIEKVSSDYSVQAHFGMRWFANIIRNLETAKEQDRGISSISEAAICAAGPSLDMQIPLLLEQELAGQKPFLISADTALPALLHQGLKPDAVVSIDCQHISYYHFVGMACRDVPLFLDIASPPLLSRFSASPFFFSGGHPLAIYVSQQWRPLPLLDTSGGNVTYACLSLAESLGAQRITVYGADFSYPAGRTYARGTYIHGLFGRMQERRSPLESRFSAFLYRSPFLPPQTADAPASCRETAQLRSYRRRFEEKASRMEAKITAAPGLGMPLAFSEKAPGTGAGAGKNAASPFAPGKALAGAGQFLERYRQDIISLPVPGENGNASAYLRHLSENQRRIFLTLLPQAAAIKHRLPELAAGDLINEVKRYCVNEIDRVLNRG